jgi:hypothetical protein
MSGNAVAILSLKGALLSYLERFLFSEDEAGEFVFTEFLHSQENQAGFWPAAHTNSSLIRQIDWQKIPVQKRQKGSSVLYISTLPQILAKKCDSADLSTVSKISQQLVNRLNQLQFDPLNSELDHNFSHLEFLAQLWPQFQIEIQRPGRIAFYLSDSGVLLWLKHIRGDNRPLLNRASLGHSPSSRLTTAQRLEVSPIETDALLWQMQYLHARCCTLLHLWQKILPTPPPAADSQRSLQSPEAQQLLQALIEIADHMFCISYGWERQQYLLLFKLTAQIYQSFDRFHRACLSGFGQISPATPIADRQLFQARFDLAEATKNVLKAMLCNHLSIKAQTSL